MKINLKSESREETVHLSGSGSTEEETGIGSTVTDDVEEDSEVKSEKATPSSNVSNQDTSRSIEIIEEVLTNLNRLDGAEGFKKRIIQNLNKLSEGNMDVIFKAIKEIPTLVHNCIKPIVDDMMAKGRMPENEWKLLTTGACEWWCGTIISQVGFKLAVASSSTTPSLISTVASFCGKLGSLNQSWSSASVLLVQQCQQALENTIPNLIKGRNIKDYEAIRHLARSSVQMLALNFDFHILGKNTVFDIVKFLTGNDISDDEIEEGRADTLLIFLKFADGGLRKYLSSDETTLLYNMIGKRMPKSTTTTEVVDRRSFLLEEINSLRDTNRTALPGSERFDFVRNWSGRAEVDRTVDIGWVPSMSIDELSQLVRGGRACNKFGAKGQLTLKSNMSADYETKELAAKKLGLHSDAQRGTFFAVINSVDAEDAVSKIMSSKVFTFSNKKLLQRDSLTIMKTLILLCISGSKDKLASFYCPVIRELCLNSSSSKIKNAFAHGLRDACSENYDSIKLFTPGKQKALGTLSAHLCDMGLIISDRLKKLDKSDEVAKEGSNRCLKEFSKVLVKLMSKK